MNADSNGSKKNGGQGRNRGEVISDLSNLDRDDLVSKETLAEIFGRHPRSIDRAVARGDLPPSFKAMGKKRWRIGDILDHFAKMQAEAIKQAERDRKSRERLAI